MLFHGILFSKQKHLPFILIPAMVDIQLNKNILFVYINQCVPSVGANNYNFNFCWDFLNSLVSFYMFAMRTVAISNGLHYFKNVFVSFFVGFSFIFQKKKNSKNQLKSSSLFFTKYFWLQFPSLPFVKCKFFLDDFTHPCFQIYQLNLHHRVFDL